MGFECLVAEVAASHHMKINIPYGRSAVHPLELDARTRIQVLEANEAPEVDEEQVIQHAVRNPIDSEPLETFLAGARDVLVIVNDATRPTPTARILDYIDSSLQRVEHRFIVATGAHRAPTEAEYQRIFGDRYPTIRGRVTSHDSKRREDMVDLGHSSNGTPILINRAAIDADRLVIIGGVVPHYFAGYTGGRKSLLPGIAGFETIEANHRLALQSSARALALRGNPVHEDMEDAIRSVEKPVFSIMVVPDKNHRVAAATAGHIHGSFERAVEKSNRIFVAPLARKADIVVSVVKPPQDIDLYQAQKGIENAKLALKDGGIIILVAECDNGVGSSTFADLLRSRETSQEVLAEIDRSFRLGYQKAGMMAEIDTWAKMWIVTDIDRDELQGLFLTPFGSVQEAVDRALEDKGPDAELLVLMDGGMTVPSVGSGA